jgi:pyrroloquinoline quinone biosynthesis protein D
MITPATRLRVAQKVSRQDMGKGQDSVVFSLSSGYLYTCNETTADFLEALDGERTLDEVIDLMLAQYDVERQVLEPDLIEIADKLVEEKLIVVVE